MCAHVLNIRFIEISGRIKRAKKDILKLQIRRFYFLHFNSLVGVTKPKAGLEMVFTEKFPTEKRSLFFLSPGVLLCWVAI